MSDLKKKANSEWKVKKVVRCVTVELKKTMYGYYKDAMPFVRVSLWRPQDVPHVSSALQVIRHVIPSSPCIELKFGYS